MPAALNPLLVERNTSVRLHVADLGDVSARVDEVGDGHVTLALSVALDEPLDALPDRGATVELLTVRGLYRMHGLIDRAAEGVVRVSLDGAPQFEQRRDHVRVRTVRPVCLTVAGAEGELSVHTVDISGGGMLLSCMEDGPKAGDRLSFRLDLGGRWPTVKGTGTVVRVTIEGFRAVRIDAMAEREREVIIQYIFERQREDAKAGRLG